MWKPGNPPKTTPSTHLYTWPFDFDNDYVYSLKLILAINFCHISVHITENETSEEPEVTNIN